MAASAAASSHRSIISDIARASIDMMPRPMMGMADTLSGRSYQNPNQSIRAGEAGPSALDVVSEGTVHGGGAFGDVSWHSLATIDDVCSHMGITKDGLTTSEAENRLQIHGANKLTPPKKESFVYIVTLGCRCMQR